MLRGRGEGGGKTFNHHVEGLTRQDREEAGGGGWGWGEAVECIQVDEPNEEKETTERKDIMSEKRNSEADAKQDTPVIP